MSDTVSGMIVDQVFARHQAALDAARNTEDRARPGKAKRAAEREVVRIKLEREVEAAAALAAAAQLPQEMRDLAVRIARAEHQLSELRGREAFVLAEDRFGARERPICGEAAQAVHDLLRLTSRFADAALQLLADRAEPVDRSKVRAA